MDEQGTFISCGRFLIEDEEAIKKILKTLGLWDSKVTPA